MTKIYRILFTVVSFLGLSFSAIAQNDFFTAANELNVQKLATGIREIKPQKFSLVNLNTGEIKAFLWSLPSENNVRPNLAPVMEIPMPDGSSARFHVWESSVQDPALEVKFPGIKTFAGQGIDDPNATIRFDYTYYGFHAAILSPNGRVYIDPYSRGDLRFYQSYYTREYSRSVNWRCDTPDEEIAGLLNRPENVQAGFCRGTQLATYRLAVACTGEYAQAVGAGIPANVHSAIVTSVNRVTGVYQQELSIKMVLIANNTDIEYLDAATDPYTNNNGGTMLGQNQTNLTTVIGLANFDIGHVFSTGGGGVAGLGVVCNTNNKARGVTGLPTPIGDAFDIDYVAHEMGHQFGGGHTFNSIIGSCGGGNRSAPTAYEPGSGTTIMAYAGICATSSANDDNTQPNSDPYFHTASFDQISTFLTGTGGTCPVLTATGNSIPVITAMNNNGANIPINTPFTLTGTATDADGDPLTYSWEEWDLGTAGRWFNGLTSNTAPLFKTRIPKTTGSRTFPDIAVILAGYPTNPAPTMGGLKGETLSPLARAMKFRLQVRDNRVTGGGVVTGGDGCGTFSSTFQVNVIATTGPFAVTVPNGGESYAGGSTQTITWNVVGTDIAPISVANVKISLSTDGGFTYPTVIAASTPNDGSEALIIPGPATTTARIKVEALGNVFFDISNANFTITVPVSDFAFGTSTASTSTCPATSPTVTIPTTATGGFSTPIVLTATAGVPVGTTVTFAPNPLTPGNSAVATLNNAGTLVPGTYNITVTGTAGATVKTTTITFTITPGAGPVITTQPVAQTVCAPATATFTVATSTAGASFQWQSAPALAGPYTNVSTGTGGTTATYTTAATTTAMNGTFYHVVLSTPCGSSTANNVSLTVNTPAAITTQPTPQAACTGNTATFTVAATGTGVFYQWQSSPTLAGVYTNVSTGTGATTNTYTTGTVTGATDQFYHVIVSSTLCPASVTSNNVQLTISTAASISTQPTSQTVCAPTSATFTVAALGTGVNYQWQVSTTGIGGPYSNLTTRTGGNTNSYNTGATTIAMSGYAYHVVVSSACNSVTSNNVTLTVNAPAVITTQPTNQFGCTGNTATFTVAATGTGVTYQWQSAATAGGPFTNVSTGTGGQTNTYTTAAITGATNGFYQVIVSTTLCPASITSNVVQLTISTTTSISTQPTAQTVCAPNSATFTVVAVGSGATYQWQVSTTGVGGTYANVTTGTGGQTNTYNTGATSITMNGNAYHVVVTNPCNSVTSNNVLLTVNAPASITTQPTPQAACTGNTATFTVAAAGTGVTYQWQSAATAGGPFTNVSTGTGGQTNTYTTAAITGATNGFYQVIVSTTLCPVTVTSNVVQLTINTTTAITTQPTNQTVCAPGAATYTVAAAGTGNTFQWQVSTTGVGGTFTNVSTGTGGTTNTYNTGATTVAMNGYAYNVIVTGACNTVTSSNVTLTVNTAAVITTQPTAQIVCNGTTATFTVAATGTGAAYQWQSGPTSTGPFTNVSTGTGGQTNSYTTAATTPAMNGTFYQVIVTTTACPGTATSTPVLLTVNTVATINTQPQPQSVCVPGTATFTVGATGTGLGYIWQVSTNGGTSFTDIPGAIGSSYTTAPVTVGMNGNLYRVQVSSTCAPGSPITSNAVLLSVNNPVSVTQNPQDQRGCAGDNFTFSVVAAPPTGINYQWQVSTNGGTTYSNVPGAGGTASSFTITNAPITLNGNLYRVIVSGGICGQVITPGALLTLGNKPTIVLTAASASSLNPSINSGLYTTVSPPGNYVYNWTKNGVQIPNTLATTSIPLTVDNFGTYQVSVIDVATGCGASSNIVRIDSLVSNHLFIYPNPVSTSMQVRYYNANPATRNTMLNVYDSKGARVIEQNFTISGTYGRMDVDMSKLIPGTYMVELRDASGKKIAGAAVVKGL
ncbi:MAG: zinc-dependent metalloprotease family protein [Ferruginibacter sp.]